MAPHSQPLVSIIIPCYNAETWVAEAIESALAQTWLNKEVIVIDDGSTDKSLEVIKRYDGCIRWVTGPNRGGCAARNQGVRLAQGGYIQFLDADDVLVTTKIEIQMERLAREGTGAMAACAWCNILEDGKPLSAQPMLYWRDYDSGLDMLIDMWLTPQLLMTSDWLVPRELIAKTGWWDESLLAAQDSEYLGRMLINADKVVFVDEVLFLYRITPQSVSRSGSRNKMFSKIRAFEKVAQMILEKRSDQRAIEAVQNHLAGVGIYSVSDFDILLAFSLIRRAKALVKSKKYGYSIGGGRYLTGMLSVIGVEMTLALYIIYRRIQRFGKRSWR